MLVRSNEVVWEVQYVFVLASVGAADTDVKMSSVSQSHDLYTCQVMPFVSEFRTI